MYSRYLKIIKIRHYFKQHGEVKLDQYHLYTHTPLSIYLSIICLSIYLSISISLSLSTYLPIYNTDCFLVSSPAGSPQSLTC